VNIFSIILAASVMTSGNAARPNYLHERSLFWVEQAKGIFHLDEAGRRVCVVESEAVIGDIAVDVNIPKLFWSEPENGEIKAFSFETGEIEVVLGGLQRPYALGIDGVRRWLFFSCDDGEQQHKRIMLAKLRESRAPVLWMFAYDPKGIEVDAHRSALIIDDGVNGVGFITYSRWRRKRVHLLTLDDNEPPPTYDRKRSDCYSFSGSMFDASYYRINLMSGSDEDFILVPEETDGVDSFAYCYSQSLDRFVLYWPTKLLAYDPTKAKPAQTLIEFDAATIGNIAHLTAPVDSGVPLVPSSRQYFLRFLVVVVIVILICYWWRRFALNRNMTNRQVRRPMLATAMFAILAFCWLVSTLPVLGRHLVGTIGSQFAGVRLIVGTIEFSYSTRPNLWSGGFHLSPATLEVGTGFHSDTWWPSFINTSSWQMIRVPIWMLAVPFIVMPIRFFIVLRRRRKRKQCWACGYDVATGGQSTCPECGWQVVVEEDKEDDANNENDQNGWTLSG